VAAVVDFSRCSDAWRWRSKVRPCAGPIRRLRPPLLPWATIMPSI
jgi:hypothetical protein